MDEQQEDENFLYKQNALAMRLQQRRSRKVLAEQGIIPPLKSPGTYFPQVQRLERARKEDYLNHAIQIRPERELLVQKHILEDTSASSSIVANQKDLKKAKLVDDLNDKIAFRPGVIELVERNIIPANEDLQEAIKAGLQYKKIADFVEEDSSDALSPEQQPPIASSPSLIFPISTCIASVPDKQPIFTTKIEPLSLSRSSSGSSLFTQGSSHPYLSRQTSKGSKMGQSGLIPRMTNTRKKKEKQRFKKFKYHQYIPPDQQGKHIEKKNLPMLDSDTPYSRLLQQQQMYLQLQIMNKQYSSQINNQRSGESQHTGSFNQQPLVSPPPAPPLTQTMKVDKPRNPNTPLTQNKLDEMKVSELKEELKMRGLKVTGTKEVLVERLRPFCVTSDNIFLSNMSASPDDGNFQAGPSMLSKGISNDSIPAAVTSVLMSVDNTKQICSTSNAQTAFPIDPNTVYSHKVARMPIPERHKIVLKQEKFTMPTWHHSGDSPLSVQTVSAPSQQSNYPYPTVELTKDKMLEKQQKEINDLKRMVELHRSQLQQLHNRKQLATKEQMSCKQPETARLSTTLFQFPTISHTNHRFPRSNQHHPPHSQQRHQEVNPPNYDQAFEMLNDSDVIDPTRDMDDLLELLTDNGELPVSPVVTRQLLNDHNSYHGLNERNQYNRRTDYITQEQAQLQREVRQNQIKNLSREYPCNGVDYPQQSGVQDLTKMLVESSGDALMDTSNFPPVIHRYSTDQQTPDYSRGSARNSVDSGVIYSTPHFSPMDTNNVDRDFINDLRLSTSSLDSGEPTLNAVSLSPATPPRFKHTQNIHASYRQHAPPRQINHNLVKSASQELLSTNDGPSTNSSMNNELGWLDLTLGSAVGGPPSPGGPFETMALEDHVMQHSRSSNPMSNHGSQDADLNLYLGGSSGTLNYPPTTNTLDPQWDSWEGLLSSNFNS